MNELQAAIGSIQVDRLGGFLEKRKENYEIISGKLDEIKQIHQFESSNGNFQSSYYCKSIVLQGGLEKKRTEVIGAMTARGVGTSIYYPRPVPELTYYREKYGSSVDEFPEAAKIANHSVALPVGPHLRSGDAEYVADAVIEVIKELL
jgi:dTDP-4-amino-4,6-dideoxygalactose transaminase